MRFWPALLVLGFTACATPQVAVNAHADFSRVHRVAVATFGGPSGDVAADLLTQDLLQHGADVVERQRLDAVLQEQNLAADNILDPATVSKIGKILGVDAIFVGTVSGNVPSQSYLVTTPRHGARINSVTPVGSGDLYPEGPAEGVPDSEVVTSAAQASLISRMVDVETGSIMWSGSMSYEGFDVPSAMATIADAFVKSLIPLWPGLHK
ncbi:MAG TPA: CsgG/HfaB family protein [Elusimicrobiota bacterium]|nr:CsgG/HfaB family protein [Elusimicrobiota bacterium]